MNKAAAEKKPYHVDASKGTLQNTNRVTFTNQTDNDAETKNKNDSDANGQTVNLAKDEYSSNGTFTGLYADVSDFDAKTKKEKTPNSKTVKSRTLQTMTAEEFFTSDQWMFLMYEELIVYDREN